MTPWRLAFIVAALASSSKGGISDIEIPSPSGGSFLVRATFIQDTVFSRYYPELIFRVANNTDFSWSSVTFRFDIGGLCNGAPRQWSITAAVPIGWRSSGPALSTHDYIEDPLKDHVDGCKSEIIEARIVTAKRPDSQDVAGDAGAPRDMTSDLERIKTELFAREADDKNRMYKLKAEADRRHASELASEEQHRRLAEKENADLEARRLQDRSNATRACAAAYKATSEKRLSDLTVKETQQIQNCMAAGLYRP